MQTHQLRRMAGGHRPHSPMGAIVVLAASLAFSASPGLAFQAPAAPPAAPGAFQRPDKSGQIAEINSDVFTLTPRQGDPVKVTIPASAKIEGMRGAAASRDDLKLDARIGVYGSAKADGTFVADRVLVMPARRAPAPAPVLDAAGKAAAEAAAAADAALHPTINLDVTGAPDLAAFAGRAKAICEAWYPALADYLKTDGIQPPKTFRLIFREMDGVAYTTGGPEIHCSAAYFRTHRDDYGAIVHEMVHVIQSYRGNNPGWLVEALDDYVRFYRYEPVNKMLRFTADRVPSDPQAYQIGAAFLNWAQAKYDKNLVPDLNSTMRKGAYTDAYWKTKTGKTLSELWSDWKSSLPASATATAAAGTGAAGSKS